MAGGPTIGGAASGSDWIPRELHRLSEELRELKSARTLEAATIGQGGIQVDSGGSIRSTDFDGALPATAGTAGWALGGAGSNAIFNSVVLRGGIIGNDALTSPVLPSNIHADQGPFSMTTTPVSKCSTTVTVPAGYTKAAIIAGASGSARNKNTIQDYWYIKIRVNGVNGPGYAAACDGQPNASIGLAITTTFFQTGLVGGGTFTIEIWAATGSVAWASDSFNALNLDALVLFLR
jgi:hypothetical protein